MDEEFEKISLEELRDEIDHLFKLKQAFMITKMKINSTNQRRELDRISKYTISKTAKTILC